MPSKTALTKKCRGLWTAPNRYDVPEGALVKATNVLIRRDGVIEPRWAITPFSTSTSNSGVDHWHKGVEFQDKLFVAGRRTDGASYAIAMGDPVSFAGYTAQVTGFDPPDLSSNFTSTTRLPFYDLEFIKSNGNLYFNSLNGVYRIGDTTGTNIRRAGGYPCAIALTPRPINTDLSRSGTTTVTATTDFAHGYIPGITVVMSSAGNASFAAGTYTIVTVPSTTTFTYVDATATTTTTLVDQTFSAAQFVGSSGFITTNEQVAYRAFLTEYDVNNVEYIGEVSTRAEVKNASPAVGNGANKNVQLAILYGASAPARSTKLQIYRTKKGTNTPGGEFYKVYEKYLTEDDRTRGYTWITDITPDSLTGEALYTNETQEGELRNNLRPACAKTLSLWGAKLVMANTTEYATIEAQLLSTDSAAGGLGNGQAIKLEGTAADATQNYYFATASGTAFNAGNQFVLYSGGTASVDVKNTVLSLIDSINWGTYLTTPAPLSTFIAKFTSVGDDWPGRFAVSRVLPDQYDLTHITPITRTLQSNPSFRCRSAFAPRLGILYTTSASITVTRASNSVTITNAGIQNCFDLGEYVVVWTGSTGYATQTQLSIGGTAVEGRITNIGATSITISNSGADGSSSSSVYVVSPKYMPTYNQNTLVNNIKVSKLRQLESFPAFSTLLVGQPGKKILKTVPCGESLLIFKEDGLFRALEDADGVLRAELIDPTAILWAKDTAVPINGKVMAWLTKGVGLISEHGVEKYVSEPVYDKLEPTSFQSLPFTQRAQAFVDEQNGLYELRICMTSGPSVPYPSSLNLTYNVFNDTWVEDDLAVVCEIFYKGKRYIQQSTSLYAQLQDAYYGSLSTTPTIDITWTALSTPGFYTTTLLTGSVTVGTHLIDDDYGSVFIVTEINGATLTGYSPTGPASGVSWAAYAPLTCTVRWAPITLVEENRLKLFREANVLFGLANQVLTYVRTNTELVQTQETLIVPYTSYGNSLSASTDILEVRPGNIRVFVPQQHRRAQQLELEVEIKTVCVGSGNTGMWTIVGAGVTADVSDPRINR